MKDCFAYIRVSTVKQSEKGVSLQEQRSAIEMYAVKNNLNIIHWFEEKVSAAKQGRPLFIDMMKRLKKKEVEAVIIHKIDRSARNLRDWADLGDLNDKGITFHFAVECLDLTSRGGRLAADIQAVVAADYIRNLRDETKKGFYGRLKQGFYPLPAPPGYLNCGGGVAKKLDPKLAPKIKKAFELYATGDYSLRSLKMELELKGQSGKPMSISGLSNVLNNSFYYGMIYIKISNETFKGIHPPLISKHLFDEVQQILKGKCGAKLSKHDFVFKRLFTCSLCKRLLIGEKQKGRVYYRCHTRGCPTTGLREDKLEEHFVDLFMQIRLPDNIFEYLCFLAQTEWQASIQIEQGQFKNAKMGVAKIDEKIERLTDAYLNGIVDQETLNKRRIILALEKEQIEAKIQNKKPNSDVLKRWLVEFLELTKTLIFTYEQADLHQKRKIIKMVTSNCSVNQKNVELEPSPRWAYLRNYNSVLTGPLSQGNSRTFSQKEIEETAHEILKGLKQIFFDNA